MTRDLMETKIIVLRAQAQDAIKRANKAHARVLAGRRRLSKFSFWIRFFSKRSVHVRQRIKELEAKRFMCTAAAMHCARSIKFLERRLVMLGRK